MLESLNVFFLALNNLFSAELLSKSPVSHVTLFKNECAKFVHFPPGVSKSNMTLKQQLQR